MQLISPLHIRSYSKCQRKAYLLLESIEKYVLTDYENVRNSSKSFMETLSKKQLEIKGKARQQEITLEEFLKSIVGHEIHHLNVIGEKYDV